MVHFPYKSQYSRPWGGTKPCFSFGKRTLGLHGPPMGPFWWSKSFGNSHYFHTCMAQNHAFPLENPHLGDLAPPMGDSGGPNYGTNRNTNGGYPGSAASKLSSALPDVTSDASEVSSGASGVSSDAS